MEELEARLTKAGLITKLREQQEVIVDLQRKKEYWYNYAMMILRQLDQVQRACARHKRLIRKLRSSG